METDQRTVEIQIGTKPVLLTPTELRELIAEVKAKIVAKRMGWQDYDVSHLVVMNLLLRHYDITGIKLWEVES